MLSQCVVLAGGRGTRMRPFTDVLPKALVPVLGRPFADWQLRCLAEQGLDRLTYCVGHGAHALRNYIGDGSRYGMNITWVSEGDHLLGTGGALRLALDQGALDDAFFVLYGDSYLPIDMLAVAQAWRASRLPALMTVMRNEGQWDTSNTIYSSGRVVLYDKRCLQRRPVDMVWIDYGLSVLTQEVVADLIPSGRISDLGDAFKNLSLNDMLAGFEVTQRFYEVGSLQGLSDLEAYLRQRVQRAGRS